MGDEDLSDDLMLANVLALSLFVFQPVEKREGPNGVEAARRLALCGIDPALKRESNVEFVLVGVVLEAVASELAPELAAGLNGLVDGVGRALLGCSNGEGWLSVVDPAFTPTGNREGTVPARNLRADKGGAVLSVTG